MMDIEQIKSLQRCYRNLALSSAAFTERFYVRLFELDPALRPLFPQDMTEQRTKLFQTLGVAVNSLDRFSELVPVLQQLGARHDTYGAKPAHYQTVGQALIDAIEATSDGGMSPEMRAAWVRAYTMIAQVMSGDAQDTAA